MSRIKRTNCLIIREGAALAAPFHLSAFNCVPLPTQTLNLSQPKIKPVWLALLHRHIPVIAAGSRPRPQAICIWATRALSGPQYSGHTMLAERW